MKNLFLMFAVAACQFAVAKVEAGQISHTPISEPHYIVVQYTAAEAQKVQNEMGYMPKRHLTPPGSTQVWAVFNSKGENADKFAQYSASAFVVARSRFQMVLQDCKNNPTTDYDARPFCNPEFLKLAEVIND